MKTQLVPMWLAVAMLACSGGKDVDTDIGVPADTDTDVDTDTDTDVDTDTDADCDASIATITPADASIMVPTDTEVVVVFDAAVPDGQWAVDVTADGNPVAGTGSLAGDGLSVTWVADDILPGETAHIVSASACDDTEAATFTTLPAPVDPALFEGNTYALPVQDLNWIEPSDPLNLLPTFFPVDFMMVQLISVDLVNNTVDAVATIGDDDGTGNAIPDCGVAVRQTADLSLNPFFGVGPQILTVDVTGQGDFADIEDFELLARISADGNSITNIQVSALVATEELVGEPTETCSGGALVTILQPSCAPCLTSTSGSCMILDGTAPLATVQPAVDIVAACGL